MKVDRIDLKILELVQHNNRLTSEQIGDTVGLSPTAVVRRLKRLRSNKIIIADVSIVSAKAVGYPISFFVLCSLEREQADTVDRFVEAVRTEPTVTSASMVAGETDFVLTVVARNIEAYHQLLRRYSDVFPGLRNVSSFAVLDQIKVGYAIPVTVDDPEGRSGT